MAESLVVLVDGVPTVNGVPVAEMAEEQIEAATLMHQAAELLAEPEAIDAASEAIAAGWYADPEGSPYKRYFDGHAWGLLINGDPSAFNPMARQPASPGYYTNQDGERHYWSGSVWGTAPLEPTVEASVDPDPVPTVAVAAVPAAAKKPRGARRTLIATVVAIVVVGGVVGVYVASSNSTPASVIQARAVTKVWSPDHSAFCARYNSFVDKKYLYSPQPGQYDGQGIVPYAEQLRFFETLARAAPSRALFTQLGTIAVALAWLQQSSADIKWWNDVTSTYSDSTIRAYEVVVQRIAGSNSLFYRMLATC